MLPCHYLATESRTLCGSQLSQRLRWLPTWPEFLAFYMVKPEECCVACLRTASKYQHLSRTLAELNVNLRRKPFYLKRRRR